MTRIVDFIRLNRNKKLTLEIWFYLAIFRLLILLIPAKYMRKFYGVAEEESSQDESKENYRKARVIAYHINRIAEHTPWESKCLVRALTAQRLFKRNHISSTLYLGVKKEGERMVAHAWTRSGEYYATGGNGTAYSVVAKFRNG